MNAVLWSYVLGSSLLGLAIGSFIAARVQRTLATLPQNLWGRSSCLSCKKNLVWKDLIPVLSYLILRGKCRHCRQTFSPVYVIIELLTALTFGGILFFGVTTGLFPLPIDTSTLWLFVGSTISTLLVWSVLIYVCSLDLLIMAFPIRFLAWVTFIIFLYRSIDFPMGFLDALYGGSLFLGTLGIIRYVGKHLRGIDVMGEGDLWIALLLGVSLGLRGAIIAFYSSFLLGAVLSVLLLVWTRKQSEPLVLPFAPFLAIGWFIALFWTEPLFLLLFPS